MKKSATNRRIGIAVLFCLLFFTVQCATKTLSKNELPDDLLGLRIGMDKTAATKRLEQIASPESTHRKAGNLWRLKNDPRFDSIAVAFDKENKVRFVTGFVEKSKARERIRFSEVGDLTKAKKEIVEQHHRFVWEVPASDKQPAYSVNVYGDNAEFVTIYSLVKTNKPNPSDDRK